MNTIGTKLAAGILAASAMFVASPAFAGKGGSAARIQAAVASGSQDAIIAEVERTEELMCPECVQTVTALLSDSRYPVREVAGWWFAKRPQLEKQMATQMKLDLQVGDAVHVRNAADFVGSARDYTALPALRVAIARGDLTSDAKLAIVRAVGFMAHIDGNGILQTAMRDGDAGVRAAAVRAWRDVLGQTSVAPIEPMLADSDAKVRAEAATVLGAYGDQNVRATLEQLVVADHDDVVRRDAAWALGKLGNAASRLALTQAASDPSGLVRGYARAALAKLQP
jgi:HEAT repeat protein